jgi:hypothetical protein
MSSLTNIIGKNKLGNLPVNRNLCTSSAMVRCQLVRHFSRMKGMRTDLIMPNSGGSLLGLFQGLDSLCNCHPYIVLPWNKVEIFKQKKI